jgi:hypothetical protein
MPDPEEEVEFARQRAFTVIAEVLQFCMDSIRGQFPGLEVEADLPRFIADLRYHGQTPINYRVVVYYLDKLRLLTRIGETSTWRIEPSGRRVDMSSLARHIGSDVVEQVYDDIFTYEEPSPAATIRAVARVPAPAAPSGSNGDTTVVLVPHGQCTDPAHADLIDRVRRAEALLAMIADVTGPYAVRHP